MGKILFLMLCLVGMALTACTPSEVYYQQGTVVAANATSTAAVATATRQAQDGQATATVMGLYAQGTKAAADAADAETRLLLARATQTVMAAQTASVAESTRSAWQTQEAQATAGARAQATQQAFVREGWTATAQGEERRATLAEGERQARIQDAQATGTRQAQDAQATGTAAAWSTQAAMSATWTAQAVMLGSTATVMQMRADATSQAAGAGIVAEQYRQEQILTEQADYGKYAWVVVAILGSLAAIALISYAMFNLARTKAVTQVVQRGALGEAPVVLVNNRALMPDRSMYAVADPARPVLPPVGEQLRLAEADVRVQGLRAAGHAPRNTLTPPPAPIPVNGEGGLSGQASALPLAAEWGLFVGYEGPEIPLGIAQDGSLMLAHPEMYPHFTVAGRSGGGKTRYGVKSKVAAALARGWYVATLGEMAPVGMNVFAGHANYQDVVVDQPELVLAFLERLYGEIRQRMGALYQHKAGRWEEMLGYGPRVMVVVDEYAAIFDDLQGEQRTRYVRTVNNICRLARKTGVHLVLGVQNPTAESIRPSTRRNTLTQVFQVVDAVASQAILQEAGAERLQGGQYLAVLQEGIRPGAAFDPSDEQIAAYLAERRAGIKVYEQPTFLQQLPAGEEPGLLSAAGIQPTAQPDPEIQRMAEKALPVWQAGGNKSDVARALGLGTGGSDWGKVQRVVDYLERAAEYSRSSSSSTGT